MSQHRDAQVTIILGRNGTGKSTYCKKIVQKIRQRALVVTYNGVPKIWRDYKEALLTDPRQLQWKRGFRQAIAARYEISQNKTELFQHLYANYRNGIIIFDDCRGYITSNIDSDKYFRHLLLDFRHKMLDIFFVVHSPSDVPPRVWGFASTVFVGSTASFLKPSQASIDDESVKRIINAQREVNEVYRQAKARNDNSHYGLFRMVGL